MPTLAKEQMVRVRSDEGRSCPLCSRHSAMADNHFEVFSNHLLKDHSLKCLHVGQETIKDREGNLRQVTVAVFGK